MIIPVYFPPYDDEYLLSWCYRLAVANKMSLKDFRKMYLQEKYTQKNRICGVFWKLQKWYSHPEYLDIVTKHDEVWAERVLVNDAKTTSYVHSLLYSNDNPLYDFRRKQTNYIRLCPECQKEDEEAGREKYVRTWHMIKDVTVCHKHGCSLIETKDLDHEMECRNVLSFSNEALDFARMMYEVYRDPYSLDDRLKTVVKNKDNDHIYSFSDDKFELIHDYEGLCEVKCRDCGETLILPKYLAECGRDCPVCEINENIVAKLMKTIPDYSLIKDVTSLLKRGVLKHNVCGNVVRRACINDVVFGKECYCTRLLTEEKIKKAHALDGMSIVKIHGGCLSESKVTLKHDACGYEFKTTLTSTSPNLCPKCYGSVNSVKGLSRIMFGKKMFDKYLIEDMKGEYVRVGEYRGTNEYVHIRHERCRYVFPYRRDSTYRKDIKCPKCNPNKIIYINGRSEYYKEEFERKMKYYNGDYECLSEYVNSHEKMKIRHVPCGYEFERNTRYIMNNHIECPNCNPDIAVSTKRTKGEKQFDDSVSALVGDEYIRIGKYIRKDKELEMQHVKCGKIFKCKPIDFLDGKRCPCDDKRLFFQDVQKYFRSFEPNFEFVKPKNNNKKYVVKFLDTGETVKMSSRFIRQESTCLCEPKYFRRKE